MTQESWFQRLWRLITPELIYLAICYIVDLAAAAYLNFSMGGEYSSGDFEKFTVVLSDKTDSVCGIAADCGSVFQYIDPASDVF